jgi:hypothetical protein
MGGVGPGGSSVTGVGPAGKSISTPVGAR